MSEARPDIRVAADGAALAAAAAERFAAAAADAIVARGRFVVALSGGSTPRALYARLASPPMAGRVEWSRVHLLWGDERCVPPESGQSNYRMAREALIDHVGIPLANVHRIRGEADPTAAAAAYEQDLRALFGSAPGATAPGIDFVLLGIGDEGHVASLFPGSPALLERTRLVLAQDVPAEPRRRVTLTFVTINAAREVAFLVSGAAKAEIVGAVIDGPRDPQRLPAQGVAPVAGRLTWFLDVPAAARLQGGQSR